MLSNIRTCFRQLSEISAKTSLSEDLASSDLALRLWQVKTYLFSNKKQKQFKWYGKCKELICRVKILLQVNNNDEKRNTFEESIRLQKEKNIYCSSGRIKVTEKNS